MSDPPLDEMYFDWLYSQVGSGPVKHKKLLEAFFFKEYVWHVPNDDNRAADGKELRREFLAELGIPTPGDEWMMLGCSMLEFLVALARRLAFETDCEPRYWFWEMVKNIGLYQYTDRRHFPKAAIDDVLDRVIWRTYDPDGRGGLFPLRFPQRDQTRVEVWYQMNAYLQEQPL